MHVCAPKLANDRPGAEEAEKNGMRLPHYRFSSPSRSATFIRKRGEVITYFSFVYSEAGARGG